METLKDLRTRVKLSQLEAAQKIGELSGGKVSPDRRRVINAETHGTENILMLEAMAEAYGVTFDTVYQANRALLFSSGKNVQIKVQNTSASVHYLVQ